MDIQRAYTEIDLNDANRNENESRIFSRMMDEIDTLRTDMEYHVDGMTSDEISDIDNDFSLDYEIAIKNEMSALFKAHSHELDNQEIAALADLKEPLEGMYQAWLENDQTLSEELIDTITILATHGDISENAYDQDALYQRMADEFLDTVEMYYTDADERFSNAYATTVQREMLDIIKNDDIALSDNEKAVLCELQSPLSEMYYEWLESSRTFEEPLLSTIKDFAKDEVRFTKEQITQREIKPAKSQPPKAIDKNDKKKAGLLGKLETAKAAVKAIHDAPVQKQDISKAKGGR